MLHYKKNFIFKKALTRSNMPHTHIPKIAGCCFLIPNAASQFKMTGVREKARFGGSNLGDHMTSQIFPKVSFQMNFTFYKEKHI